MTSITLSKDYYYVILSGVGMAFTQLYIFQKVTGMRREVKLAYPDQGEGPYAKKLNEKDWVKFACVQRGHQNLIEVWPAAFLGLIFGGVYYPRVIAGLGATWSISRIFYASLYRKSPESRAPASGVSFLSIYGMLGTAAYGAMRGLEWF